MDLAYVSIGFGSAVLFGLIVSPVLIVVRALRASGE